MFGKCPFFFSKPSQITEDMKIYNSQLVVYRSTLE